MLSGTYTSPLSILKLTLTASDKSTKNWVGENKMGHSPMICLLIFFFTIIGFPSPPSCLHKVWSSLQIQPLQLAVCPITVFFFCFFCFGFTTGNVACNHKGEWTGPSLRSLMVVPLSQGFHASKKSPRHPTPPFFSISWLLMQAARANVALQTQSDREACGKPDRRAGRVASLLTATVRPAPLQRGGGTVSAPCFSVPHVFTSCQ